MPCTIQHSKYLCCERTWLTFLLRKVHLILPSHPHAPKQHPLIVLLSYSLPFTRKKTSIIQAVFSDLGLAMAVREASKRQIIPTTWSELGHCSQHLLNPLSHSFSGQHLCLTLNLPNYSWLWGQRSDDFFPLLLSIPFNRYNYFSVT